MERLQIERFARTRRPHFTTPDITVSAENIIRDIIRVIPHTPDTKVRINSLGTLLLATPYEGLIVGRINFKNSLFLNLNGQGENLITHPQTGSSYDFKLKKGEWINIEKQNRRVRARLTHLDVDFQEESKIPAKATDTTPQFQAQVELVTSGPI